MGRARKRLKGRRGAVVRSKKTEEDAGLGDSSMFQITQEQYERARLAATNRTEDPLKNWARPPHEECPICMLPLPYETSGSNYCVICGKTFCMGCVISTVEAHARDGEDSKTATEKALSCPYCRSNTTASYDNKFQLENEMRRANAGNDEAMRRLGRYYFNGEMSLRQDKAEGLKWYRRAVEAGSGRAAYILVNVRPRWRVQFTRLQRKKTANHLSHG